MPKLQLEGDFITLAHALKVVDQAASGGEAKHLVRGGTVLVNGEVEMQAGRKLRIGDRFSVQGLEEDWIIS